MENKKKEIETASPGPFAAQRPILIDSWLKSLLIFLLVILAGFFLLNQALGFFYKTQFLKGPCNLCGELNPEVKSCINNLNAPRPSFPDGSGGWTNPFNDSPTYSFNITP